MGKRKLIRRICEKCTWPVISAPSAGGRIEVVIDADDDIRIDFGFEYDPAIHKKHECRKDLCIICHGGTPFEQVEADPQKYLSWLKVCDKCKRKLDRRQRAALFYY